MEGVAVTRIKDQNFQMLSCYHIADYKKDENKVVFNKQHVKRLLSPLKEIEGGRIAINKVEEQAKDFLLKNLQEAPQIILWKFKSERETEYGIAFQKVGTVIFAFLLTPLTDDELKEIERQSEGVSYWTGDSADPFTTKKDFIQ